MPPSLRDAVVDEALSGAAVPFPDHGGLRVHPHPDQVYRPAPDPSGAPQPPGPNRFDDPHHHYPVRYFAEHLYVCLLEVMARLRANADADAILLHMTPGLDHRALRDLVDPTKSAEVEGFLATNKVAVFMPPENAPVGRLVDVFNPDLLAALDSHHRIREQLCRREVVDAYGKDGTIHLDGSLIRNASKKVGRPVTQEISWLLIDVLHVRGLRYYSRHAEGEEAVCWALHGDVPMHILPAKSLDPTNDQHRSAVQRVADQYRLPLPARWM